MQQTSSGEKLKVDLLEKYVINFHVAIDKAIFIATGLKENARDELKYEEYLKLTENWRSENRALIYPLRSAILHKGLIEVRKPPRFSSSVSNFHLRNSIKMWVKDVIDSGITKVNATKTIEVHGYEITLPSIDMNYLFEEVFSYLYSPFEVLNESQKFEGTRNAKYTGIDTFIAYFIAFYIEINKKDLLIIEKRQQLKNIAIQNGELANMLWWGFGAVLDIQEKYIDSSTQGFTNSVVSSEGNKILETNGLSLVGAERLANNNFNNPRMQCPAGPELEKIVNIIVDAMPDAYFKAEEA